MACPIPAEAPVTIATFPVNLSIRFLLFDLSVSTAIFLYRMVQMSRSFGWLQYLYRLVSKAHPISVKRGKTSQRLGRPRSFDPNKALDRAMRLFWRKGYEGTSLSDLTKAMGISRPSLYAAFGDKEALFRKALERYAEGPACHVRESVNEATARKVVARLFADTIELIAGTRKPRGCFLVQSALACGEAAAPARRETAKRRA